MPDQPIELYQLIGSALRDVAQARFMSDLYSRQISFSYERDALLRRFPVPRVDIDEAQIVLHFAIKDVQTDPARRISRNAAIGSLFDQYSARIVRDSLEPIRRAVQNAASGLDDVKRTALANVEKKLLSEDSREALSGRLLQYFNENVTKILDEDATLRVDVVLQDFELLKVSIHQQPEIETLKAQLPAAGWDFLAQEDKRNVARQIQELALALKEVGDRYPDYRITLEMDPEKIRAAALPTSSITIKGSVRDYKWAKVDVDKTDLRNVRTLTSE